MPADICRFAEFELDRSAYQLRRKGRPVQLERIPLDLLFLLADKCGQLVTREEIFERVWGKGVFLDTDNAINTAVRKIRHALHDDSDSPRFVATVPAKGYRFVAPLRDASTARLEPPRIQRHQNSLIGRERAMAKLRAGLDEAASGRGRLFLISGEPGVGKTRLADEVAAASDARGMTLLVGHCSEHDEAVAYLPFVEVLENFVDRASNADTLRTALGDQGPELARLLPKLKTILPELPPPLDLPPAQARRHLFNCFCDLIARIASEQPSVMILDDLHWADDSTLSLLDHLTQRLSGLPLMVIGTYRDAELNVTRELAKALENLLRGRLATRVRLKPLARDEVAEMLLGLSGKSPPATVVGEIFAETEGNPFFVEELFRHLEEEDRLYDSSGGFRSKLQIAELEAPPSVRLVVARRLARLSDLTQKMLATAAVIGRFFNSEILQASGAGDAEAILERVEEAEKAGLVSPSADHLRFEFSHELVRQAVISGLSASRRQRLHLEVAGAIERIHADAPDDHSADLAHHYRLGGNPTKAVHYLIRAAEQAASRSAHQEAIFLARMGLELLKTMPNGDRSPQHELELQMMLGSCSKATSGYAAQDVERAFGRALELCDRVNQTPAAVRARLGLHAYYMTTADFHRAEATQVKLLESEPMLAEPALRANIYYTAGLRSLYQGDLEVSKRQLEQALRWSAGHRVHAYACAVMAHTMWNLGYQDQASKRIGEAESRARVLRNPFAEVSVADLCATIHMIGRDAMRAKAYAGTMARIANEFGFATELISSNIARGWADAWLGDPGGIELLRKSMHAWWAVGNNMNRSQECGWLAELYLRFGRNKEANEALDEGLEFGLRTNQGLAESDLYRLKGETELRLGRSNSGSAARWFVRAIDAAQRRSAKIAELRATVSLARLLAKQRKRDKAHAMLREIYNWFTEGFDTADLKDAKALLDELNS
jgi:predicted ATPase/DNA-binding winged helix-turn-helix (wHTH) protein